MKFFKKYGLTFILVMGILLSLTSVVYSKTLYASCYGFKYAWYENTQQDANIAADRYGRSGYTAIRYYDSAADPAVNTMIADSIFFFSGHATSNSLMFYNGKENSFIYSSSIRSKDLSNMKLAVLGGCNTAQGNDNITMQFKNRGAKCVIGWTRTVSMLQHSTWLEYFNDALEDGDTINDACDNADFWTRVFHAGLTGGTTSHAISGDGSITIK